MIVAHFGLLVLVIVFVAPAFIAFGLICYPVITLCACGAVAVFMGVWWAFGTDANSGQTGGGMLVIGGLGFVAVAVAVLRQRSRPETELATRPGSAWGFMPMNEGPEQPDDTDERRARVIAELLEKAAASPDPIGWVRDFTLRALRALSLGSLPAADRADARREIGSIGREVSGVLRRRLPPNGGEPAKELSGELDPSEPPPQPVDGS
jgi:hypothetical protein